MYTTMREALMAHHGEAEAVRQRFQNLRRPCQEFLAPVDEEIRQTEASQRRSLSYPI
jgi:alkylhydroperoxidase/carboxymuconolactone decarboxylase family protein YurZ